MTGRTPSSRAPGLRHERALLAARPGVLAGVDEVGRGALAGPVSVGVVVIDAQVRRPPTGLRDSKLLSPTARQALVPRIRRWALACAVGHATAPEIDALGLTAALRLAGTRAIDALPTRPDLVLLDGNFDWLSPPAQTDLFEPAAPSVSPPVTTRIQADVTCASVAAASVLAKTERDALMTRFSGQYPAFGWQENKGYASPAHQTALADHGPCALHRLSWRLGDGAEDVEGWRATMAASTQDGDETAAVTERSRA